MSRSGYSDEGENVWLWRGAVDKALKGKRGQAFLREMIESLDAIPDKCLIESALIEEDGSVCAMGAVAKKRGLDVSELDPYESREVADVMGIAWVMACEIAYMNDEAAWKAETPQERWARMRKWAAEQIKELASSA